MVGLRLKLLRGKRTQEDIAKAIGISRARYSHYENERSEIDHDTLLKLSDYFNVSTDYILGKTNNSSRANEDTDLEEILNDPELGLWYKELKDSGPEARKEALKFLRYLNDQEKDRKPGDKQGE